MNQDDGSIWLVVFFKRRRSWRYDDEPSGKIEMPIFERAVAGLAAVLCAAAVALGAYASHGLQGQAQSWVQTAAAYLLPHGIALFLMAQTASGLLRRAGMLLLLVGVALFAGSLIGAALWQWPTRLAPIGGSLLILGWLVQALSVLRR